MTARLESVHPMLMPSHVAVSVRFYERLGFSLAFQDSPADPKYAGIKRHGVELHLQWHDQSQCAYPNDRTTYRLLFETSTRCTPNFARTEPWVRRPPVGSPWLAPGDTSWGIREFHVRDPGGNGLQFYRSL